MRIDDATNLNELSAAHQLLRLASSVEDSGYYGEDQHPPAVQKQLEKAWRILQPAIVYYHDETLCWTPAAADTRFQKRSKS